MAFSLVVYTSESNYNNGYYLSLSDGAPYKLESLEDAGPADVARFSQSSPDQQGATDLGYRVQPRVFVASVLFEDGTDVDWSFSGEDEDNRVALHSLFRPSHLVYLRLTRDDGEVRILQCHAQQIEIDLVPEHYAAGLNRATITLRAANPLWYTATAKSATYARSTTWPTAGTAIPSGNVKEYGNYPEVNQVWTFANPNTAVNAWSILIRSGSVPAAGAGTIVAYNAGTGNIDDLPNKNARIFSTGGVFRMGTGFAFAGSAVMTAGTHNYIQTHDGTTWRNYRGTVLESEVAQDIDLKGVSRRWRGNGNIGSAAADWPAEFPYYAIYDIELSSTQRAALDTAVNADITESGGGTITTVNLGDVTEYPLITVRGPIVNPVLTNVATGDVMDFTGVNLALGQQLTIDLRTGYKSATDTSGSVTLGDMGTPAQLASWGLAPAPVAAGGTNLIAVTGGSITSDTLVTVTYYDRHLSF